LGTGFAIVNVRLPEVPPPGAGVNTDTSAVPAAATSDTRIEACSCVPLTNAVVRTTPFQRTTDELANPLPFPVRVNAEPPATTLSGETLDATGGGVNARSTVTVALVAFRTSLTNSRNS